MRVAICLLLVLLLAQHTASYYHNSEESNQSNDASEEDSVISAVMAGLGKLFQTDEETQTDVNVINEDNKENDTDEMLQVIDEAKSNIDEGFDEDEYDEARGKKRVKRQGTRAVWGNVSRPAPIYSPRRFSVNLPDLDQHFRTCDSCLIDWASFQCPLNEKGLELQKWVLQLQKLLGFGCQFSDQCSSGRKCCHRRDATLERALSDLIDLTRSVYTTFQSSCKDCPEDGGWSKWCEWGSCSVSCGQGTQSRTRECNNPTPRGDGKQCFGKARDTKPCNNPDCCIHGNWTTWSPWGECSITCGQGGVQRRTRTCTNPAPNRCGRICPGSGVDIQSCPGVCGGLCCVDGSWSEWLMTQPCPSTCSRVQSIKRRFIRYCNNPPPNECGRSCCGSNTKSEDCPSCPDCVDGRYSLWGPWGQCTDNFKVRTRTCTEPVPNDCGSYCLGEPCEVVKCGCEWANWNSWTNCNNKRHTRTRQCRDIVNGQVCSNERCGRNCGLPQCDYEEAPCGEEECDNPMWTEWGKWCPCDCRTGKMARRRACKLAHNQNTHVDISRCTGGVAREERDCDVSLETTCPKCLRPGDCQGKKDGVYPSCRSCRHKMQCLGGQMVNATFCREDNTQWDHFRQKCVPESMSCTVETCINSCSEVTEPGQYHKCGSCQGYLVCPERGRPYEQYCPRGEEFHSHGIDSCVTGRSPTCPYEALSAILYRDAPAEEYLTEEEKRQEEDEENRKRKEEEKFKAMHGDKVTKVADDVILNSKEEKEKRTNTEAKKEGKTESVKGENVVEGMIGEREKEAPTAAVKMTASKSDKKRRKGWKKNQTLKALTDEPRCQKDCTNVKPGRYQSCRGCGYYLVCTKHGFARQMKCPLFKQWDDKRKKCKYHSHTCNSTFSHKLKP